MEGAHVKEELVLLLLIVAKQGWRRRRRRRGCSYEQSLILKAEDMYLVDLFLRLINTNIFNVRLFILTLLLPKNMIH